jgi:hypothetical protein
VQQQSWVWFGEERQSFASCDSDLQWLYRLGERQAFGVVYTTDAVDESLPKIRFSRKPKSTKLLLQTTIARATAEQWVTRAFNPLLWNDYGSRLDSSYTSMRDSEATLPCVTATKSPGVERRSETELKAGAKLSVMLPQVSRIRLCWAPAAQCGNNYVETNYVHQKVNPYSPTAVLGQVEAADALSVLCRSIDIHATRLCLVEKEPHVAALYDHYALAQFVFTHLYHCLRQSTPMDSWCRSYPTVMSFFGFRFVLQHSMTTFMKDIFVVDSDYCGKDQADHEARSLRSSRGHAILR